ncbi:uncharacterized protein V2V93DRAFT_181583 [Kockiozyma suomiensis]|uniref:uncharacterized protein n=1 Tax=Kockiozyma suomiensis TaxID=1337062 RepID=UPI003343D910
MINLRYNPIRPRIFKLIHVPYKRGLSSSTDVVTVIPSPTFIDSLGRRFHPEISSRKMIHDLKRLLSIDETDKGKLNEWFGDGRKLVSYMRIIERGFQEDTSRAKQRMTTRESMAETVELVHKLTRVSVTLGNQYAIARRCMGDIMKPDEKINTRARNVLIKLRDTNLAFAYFICGNLFMSGKQYDKAAEEYQNAISAAKAHVEASAKDDMAYYDYDREADFSCMLQSHFMLGQVGELTQDIELARQNYIKGVELREISGELLQPFEVAAANYLSVVAEWEHNPAAMEYYGIKSAMSGNVYGILATTRVGKRYDEDPRWAQKWQEVLQIQGMADSNIHVTLQSPSLAPMYVTKLPETDQRKGIRRP